MPHLVMNCKDFNEARFKPGVISPKVDGVRAYYYPGQKELTSRSNKPIRGMDHIIADLQDMKHPVDMELHVPGLEFNEVSGIIRNHQNTPQVVAHVIDIVAPGGIIDRLALRPRATSSVINIPNYRIHSIEAFWKIHYKFIDLEYEGSVIKTYEHLYRNNRSFDWMREVPIKSEDCTILDGYEGKGKMAGMLGGFIIDFCGIACKVGTLKDVDYAMRQKIWYNLDEYIGQAIEVQYKNLQPSGKPRQPRMKAFRWDK